MKQNKKTYFGIFLLLVLFQAVIACSNNSSNNSSAVPSYNHNPYNPLCPNCTAGMGGAPLLTNVRSATGSERVLFGLDILAMNGGMGMNLMDPKAAVMYSGMVAIAGTMRVLDQNNILCNAMPGDYTIQTVQPISMSALTLMGGKLVAQGPAGQIVMNILNAQFYNSFETVVSYSQNNRVGFLLIVESVNNYPCGGDVRTF